MGHAQHVDRLFAAKMQRGLVLAGKRERVHGEMDFCLESSDKTEQLPPGCHIEPSVYSKWAASRREFNRLCLCMEEDGTLQKVVDTCNKRLLMNDPNWVVVSDFLVQMTGSVGRKALEAKVVSAIPQPGLGAFEAFHQSLAAIMSGSLFKLVQEEDRGSLKVIDQICQSVEKEEGMQVGRLGHCHVEVLEQIATLFEVKTFKGQSKCGQSALGNAVNVILDAEACDLDAKSFSQVLRWSCFYRPRHDAQYQV